MEKLQAMKLIKDHYFDNENLFNDWIKGKIDDETILDKMKNLCFNFLQSIIEIKVEDGR